MAIYEDIHEIDRIDEHVDDESVAALAAAP